MKAKLNKFADSEKQLIDENDLKTVS